MAKHPNLTTIDGQLYARVSYKDPRTGKWKSKTQRVKNAKEGRAVAAKLKEQYASITPAQLDAETMTFSDLLTQYPKSLPAWYVAPLRERFGSERLQAIDYAMLQAFRAARLSVPHKNTGQPRAETSINREMEVLRRLFGFAVKRGWLARNPFNQGDTLLPKSAETPRARIPTDDEINRLLEHATGPRAHLRPLIFAALDTGLRKGKLLGLTLAQIDLENRLLDLGKPVVRNKKHPQFVGLTNRLARELEAWLALYTPGADEPLFGIRSDFKRAWKTLCKLAQVTDLHFHDLRHWAATNAVLAGLPKDLVKKQIGHATDEMFDRYLNIDARIARQFAATLDAYANSHGYSQVDS